MDIVLCIFKAVEGTFDDLYKWWNYTLWDLSKECNLSFVVRDKDTGKIVACNMLLTDEQEKKVTLTLHYAALIIINIKLWTVDCFFFKNLKKTLFKF